MAFAASPEQVVKRGGGVQSTVIATRLEPTERQALERLAALEGKSPTQLVRRFIREGMAKADAA